MKTAKSMAILLAMLLLLAAPSHAHHLWVMTAGDDYAVARGIFPERTDSYGPACVQEIRAYDADGNAMSVRRNDEQKKVTFKTDQPVALAAVVSRWGHRVNTTEGKKLMPRQEAEAAGLRVISAFFSTQFSKTLFTSSPKNDQPLGLKLEIVPMKDPLQAAKGGQMPVRLLYEGKPLAHTVIFILDDREFKTDAEGIARVDLGKNNIQLLYARHKIPAENDPNLDYQLFTTFLTYEVK